MDFDLSTEAEDFRGQLRAFFSGAISPEVRERIRRTGEQYDMDFYRELAARGLIALSWPVEFGGGGRNALESAVFFEEANYAKAPMVGLNPTMVASHAIVDFGGDAMCREVLPRVLAGEILIALGFSEPDSGSDVAGARTSAVRDGDEWVINGQKVFTTNAESATFILLLARTDPTVPKHKGLTVFLLPADTPGIEVAPLYTIAERTNSTYYTNVRVADRWRVGAVNDGWRVMTTALAHERGGHGYAGQMMRLLDDIVRALAELDDDALPWLAEHDALVDEALGRFACEVEISRLLDMETAAIVARGELPSVEGSMAKLFSSESQTRGCARMLDLLGPYGLLTPDSVDPPADGWIEEAHRLVTPATVYGGASEVQRSIIAERGLRLPRSR